MKLSTPQRKILEMCVEDVYGLWEILWGLQELFPDSTPAELRDTAESALKELLAKGWICLFRRRGAAGEEVVLQPEEAGPAISEQRNWDEPTIDAEQIVVGATAVGEQAYYRRAG
jgi:hypothetical protein